MLTDKIKTKCINNAFALLRMRPRSEHEIRCRLAQKGYDGEVVEYVVSKLKAMKEIDDGRFAKLWVDNRMHLNPVGDVILRHELKEKGVSSPIIEDVLSKKAEEYNEAELALKMAREKFELFKKIDRRKALKRVYDFLLRRGFKYETVREVIEELTITD